MIRMHWRTAAYHVTRYKGHGRLLCLLVAVIVASLKTLVLKPWRAISDLHAALLGPISCPHDPHQSAFSSIGILTSTLCANIQEQGC